MASITEQKYDTRIAIYTYMDQYLATYPERVTGVALGLTQRLAGRMTLEELISWKVRLIKELGGGENNGT